MSPGVNLYEEIYVDLRFLADISSVPMQPVSQAESILHPVGIDQSLILDQVDDAIALLNRDHRLVLFNQKLVQMWALSTDWLREKPKFSDVLAKLVEQGCWSQQQRQQVLQVCQDNSFDSHAVQIDQKNRIHLELYPTATSNGGQLLIFRDLTTQKRYQDQLADEVRRLSFLLGLTERLQTSEDLEEIGRFALTYLVEAMGAAFGDVKVISGQGQHRRAGTLTNQIAGEFIATYGAPVVAAMEKALYAGIPYGQGLLWEVVESGQPIFVEDYAQHPNAVEAFRHPNIGQLGIFPIPSADGTIIGVLTLESRIDRLQDAPQQDMLLAACRTLGAAIERAQAQERLHRINQDLERASRLKSEFLAAMSHELRTPLNSILGFAELLLRQQQELGQRRASHVSAIKQSGQHLLYLINDILDLSKVEAGKTELDLQPVSIQAMCNQCLRMMQPRVDRKRLSLSLEMDYQVDEVVLDERRVSQMLINLLSNAVKFTPEKGKVRLTVRLAYGRELAEDQRPDTSPINVSTPYLCLEVMDTGIGIPEDKQALLFQPFQQIDSALNRRHEGTGLGLALTKRLAELHGGTVSFQSVPGNGSRFRIWLPMNELRVQNAIEPQPIDSPDQLSRWSSDAPLSDERPRVLVVEDQPYNQSLIAELLEMEGFAMELISDGATMAHLLQSDLVKPHTLPHIVLMDIQLPHVDGLQLIRQLKANELWAQVPVIAVTAMAMAKDRNACLQAGADDYISKPLEFHELIQKIRHLLEPPDKPQAV